MDDFDINSIPREYKWVTPTCRCSPTCTQIANETGYHPGHESNAVNRKHRRGRKREARKANKVPPAK